MPTAPTESTSTAPAEVAAGVQLGLNPSVDAELVIGLIAPVGVDLDLVRRTLASLLEALNYIPHVLRVTTDVLPSLISTPEVPSSGNEYNRLVALMNAGDQARRLSEDNGIVALAAIASIGAIGRDNTDRKRHVYIISALKHPDEINLLRRVYSRGFFLIGIDASEERRLVQLIDRHQMKEEEARSLMKRDAGAEEKFGQQVTKSFHLSDFFVRHDGTADALRESLSRIVRLLFGNPHLTPTFDEYAMYLAFIASLRSGDLSRQVGAAITIDNQVLALGANDCPSAGGGLYWSTSDPSSGKVIDPPDGRDAARLFDSNHRERDRLIDEAVLCALDAGLHKDNEDKLRDALKRSRLHDITEYGRVVHAEMDALLACARIGTPTKNSSLFTTTFPCHNCAKHIIASGVKRVVYIEPYVKSRAFEFHREAIYFEGGTGGNRSAGVRFEAFTGVGPRRFLDLFSMNLGDGYPLTRKTRDGSVTTWPFPHKNFTLRLQMERNNYEDFEEAAAVKLSEAKKRIASNHISGVTHV